MKVGFGVSGIKVNIEVVRDEERLPILDEQLCAWCLRYKDLHYYASDALLFHAWYGSTFVWTDRNMLYQIA